VAPSSPATDAAALDGRAVSGRPDAGPPPLLDRTIAARDVGPRRDVVAAPAPAGDDEPRREVAAPRREPDEPPAAVATPAAELAPASPAKTAPAHLTIEMGHWCDLSLDGTPRGRVDAARPRELEVEAGRHELRCAQGAGLGDFRASLSLAPGERRVVRGDPVARVALRFELARGEVVRIDGRRYADGSRVELTARRYRVELERGGVAAPGGATWITLRAPCVIRSRPRLGCFLGPGEPATDEP
jgi:hypothetical protein